MEQYYFLYGLAFVWILFAIVQDFRRREVSNWLNFSLIGFVLAYRAFYALISKDLSFFLLGAGGVLLFVAAAYALYYGRAFAGGDAKLLMGLGGILPYQTVFDVFYMGIGFIFVLFLLGAAYSLIYTFFLSAKNWKLFEKEFKKQFIWGRNYLIMSVIATVLLQIFIYSLGFYDVFGLLSLAVILLPILFIYTKAVERSSLIVFKSYRKLQEGDWLEREMHIAGRKIEKSVHGLTGEEIDFLRKHKMNVWVKEGIPFTPAFLFALILAFWFFS